MKLKKNYRNLQYADGIISLDSPSPPESPSMLLARHSANGYTNISTASANLNAALLANSFDAQTYLNFPDFTSSSSTHSSMDRFDIDSNYLNFSIIFFSISLFPFFLSIFSFLSFSFYFYHFFFICAFSSQIV